MSSTIKYKNTNLEWCPQIPENWEVKKLKYLLSIYGRIGFRGYNVSDLVSIGEGAITLSPSNIKEFGMDYSKCSYLSWEKYEESPEIKIDNEDIIFVKTGSSYGKVGIVINLPEKATINPQLLVFKNLKINSYFFFYFLYTENVKTQIEGSVIGGTIPTISQEKIGNYSILVPPIPEQQKIATFLDEKTTQIDTIITKKQKLIDCLKEERIAIINQAVTKGLDENVKMKQSNEKWLGDIPKHWQMIKLKWTAKIYSGGTPNKNNSEFWINGTVPWLNSGTVNQFFITEPSEFITEEALNSSSAKWIPENSVVIALAGQGKTKGMVGLTTFKTTCNQSMGVICPDKNKLNERYLLYFLHINYKNLRGLTGEGRDGLNLEVVGDVNILIPSIAEQISIVTFVESQTVKIDKTISKIEQEIELIKEYKTSLINEVVTGKIILN